MTSRRAAGQAKVQPRAARTAAAPLLPLLRLSAHLQWVDPAEGTNESIWLGGLRARVAF
jgi:hypothetical protein